MNSIDNVLAVIVYGLISYFLHSSALLCVATAAQHLGMLKPLHLAERAWRFALFGGLLSSILSSLLWMNFQSAPPTTIAVETISPKVALSDDFPQSQANSVLPPSIATHNLSTPFQAQSAGGQISSAASTSTVVTAAWEIQENLKQLTRALLIAWLLYIGFILAKATISVRYLHRLATSLPLVERADLQALLQRLAPHAKISIRICHHRTWSSPFVCPDGTICMPAWALQDVDPEQTYAMLTHEVQHVLRADGKWRIAQQLITSIFFFQPLNRYANQQLQLLAEIDCDHSAIQSCSVENYSRSLLRCAEMYYANTPPVFASSMAKPSSLLRRINLLFNEDAMYNLISEKHIKQANAGAIGLSIFAVLSLSGISFAMPAIHFASESIPALATNTNTNNSPTLAKTTSVELATLSEPAHANNLSVTIGGPADAPNDRPNDAAIDVPTYTTTSNIANPPSKLATPAVQAENSLSTSSKQSAVFEQAQAAYHSKNFPLALQLFRELAKSGHAEAQFAAGEMLWLGEGEKANPEAAITLLSQAAGQGHMKAQKYVELFAQRAQHQTELNYLTQNFDGGKLKWTEQTCERPTLSSTRPATKEYTGIIDKLNANLTCYNSYVASLKQSLASENYLSADLRRLMRADEIEQSKQLVQNVYYEMGVQAMRNSEQMLAEFDNKNQLWRADISNQVMRNEIIKREMEQAHFARMLRPQVEVETGIRTITTSTNPNVSPNTK